jgi:hypothetical protein
MNVLDTLAGIINTQLQATTFDSKAFQSAYWNRIADDVLTTHDDGHDTTQPMIVAQNGDCTSVSLDDTVAMQVFHKLASGPAYSLADGDIGNAGTMRKEVTDMYIVVMGDRNRLNGTRPEELVKGISVGMPLEFTNAQMATLGVSNLFIELGATDTDCMKIYNQEFRGPKYAYSTNTIMATVRYRVTAWIPSACYKICP